MLALVSLVLMIFATGFTGSSLVRDRMAQRRRRAAPNRFGYI
ncbi:MAG TPA: hypothetical protein VHL98_14985 [Microvirga sp.]|jgi:hypothetical protein|nr:hypothetical protein [Microvirga sp.]